MRALIVLLVLLMRTRACISADVSTAEELIQAATTLSPQDSKIVITSDIVLRASSAPEVEIAPGAVVSILGGGSEANAPTLDLSSAQPVFQVLEGMHVIRNDHDGGSIRVLQYGGIAPAHREDSKTLS